MNRKFLLSASLASLTLLAIPATARAAPQNQSQQQSPQAKTVAGKVTSIGTDRKSFAMEVSDNSGKRTMQFYVDGKTAVQGRVGAGTAAVVQYQSADNGSNLALTVTAENQQPNSPNSQPNSQP
jgi:hypothetical protein